MNQLQGFTFTIVVLLHTSCFSQNDKEVSNLRRLDSSNFKHSTFAGYLQVSQKSCQDVKNKNARMFCVDIENNKTAGIS